MRACNFPSGVVIMSEPYPHFPPETIEVDGQTWSLSEGSRRGLQVYYPFGMTEDQEFDFHVSIYDDYPRSLHATPHSTALKKQNVHIFRDGVSVITSINPDLYEAAKAWQSDPHRSYVQSFLQAFYRQW